VVVDTETANTARVVELVRAELLRLRREPPAAAELAFVQRALIDGLPYLFDSAEEIAGYFAEDEYLGRPHSFWTSYRERLAAVTPAELRRAASEALDPDRLLVLIVGRTRDLRLLGNPTRLPARDPVTLEAR
jgi:zinc protease